MAYCAKHDAREYIETACRHDGMCKGYAQLATTVDEHGRPRTLHQLRHSALTHNSESGASTDADSHCSGGRSRTTRTATVTDRKALGPGGERERMRPLGACRP